LFSTVWFAAWHWSGFGWFVAGHASQPSNGWLVTMLATYRRWENWLLLLLLLLPLWLLVDNMNNFQDFGLMKIIIHHTKWAISGHHGMNVDLEIVPEACQGNIV
jgi:hypothetical protein